MAPPVVSSHLLIDEAPLQFLPSLALVLGGANDALFVQQVHFLCRITEKARHTTHHFKGRWWVYNSYEAWHTDHFPWVSTSTIKRIFLSLEKRGVLLSQPFKRGRAKVGKWYALDYERLNALYKAETTSVSVQIDSRSYQNDTGSRIKTGRGSYQNETSSSTETTTETTYRDNGRRADSAAADHITISDLETALKGINKGLAQPFTGVKTLAAKLHQRGEAARTVNEAWAACQVADNPAGAFMLWMKDGYIPAAPVAARRTKRGASESTLRPASHQPTEEEVAAYIASTTPLPEWKYE